MKPHTNISIHLVRSNSNKSKDDVITIKPITNSLVSMTFVDKYNNTNHEIDMSHNSLAQYFENLFHIISYDREPYENVQVTFPAFPAIYMAPSDFVSHPMRHRLQEMLRFTLETSFPAILDLTRPREEEEDEEEYVTY